MSDDGASCIKILIASVLMGIAIMVLMPIETPAAKVSGLVLLFIALGLLGSGMPTQTDEERRDEWLKKHEKENFGGPR